MHDDMRRIVRRYLLVWIALIGLLTLSFASSWVDMGVWNGVVNLAIAAVKASLVAIVFMHAASSGSLVKIVAVAALFALGLLFVLSGTDFATREVYRAPWQVPRQIAPLGTPGG